jgi:hypothetical protein
MTATHAPRDSAAAAAATTPFSSASLRRGVRQWEGVSSRELPGSQRPAAALRSALAGPQQAQAQQQHVESTAAWADRLDALYGGGGQSPSSISAAVPSPAAAALPAQLLVQHAAGSVQWSHFAGVRPDTGDEEAAFPRSARALFQSYAGDGDVTDSHPAASASAAAAGTAAAGFGPEPSLASSSAVLPQRHTADPAVLFRGRAGVLGHANAALAQARSPPPSAAGGAASAHSSAAAGDAFRTPLSTPPRDSVGRRLERLQVPLGLQVAPAPADVFGAVPAAPAAQPAGGSRLRWFNAAGLPVPRTAVEAAPAATTPVAAQAAGPRAPRRDRDGAAEAEDPRSAASVGAAAPAALLRQLHAAAAADAGPSAAPSVPSATMETPPLAFAAAGQKEYVYVASRYQAAAAAEGVARNLAHAFASPSLSGSSPDGAAASRGGLARAGGSGAWQAGEGASRDVSAEAPSLAFISEPTPLPRFAGQPRLPGAAAASGSALQATGRWLQPQLLEHPAAEAAGGAATAAPSSCSAAVASPESPSSPLPSRIPRHRGLMGSRRGWQLGAAGSIPLAT